MRSITYGRLTEPEREVLREAADSLFFGDDDADMARSTASEVLDELRESGRWEPGHTETLMNELTACAGLERVALAG